jgi:hypothetical protein
VSGLNLPPRPRYFERWRRPAPCKGCPQVIMNNIIYIVGLIVVVIAVLSFFGLR